MRTVTAEFEAHSIDSEESALWLAVVDEGEVDLTMIVEPVSRPPACRPKASSPGPLAAGAFDNGMRILAASQSDEFAQEDQHLRQGMLTHNSINDGLEADNADHERVDSKAWPTSGSDIKRVPTLADEVKSGTVKATYCGHMCGAVRVDVPAASAEPSAAARPAQQVALFDFAKKMAPVVMGARECIAKQDAITRPTHSVDRPRSGRLLQLLSTIATPLRQRLKKELAYFDAGTIAQARWS